MFIFFSEVPLLINQHCILYFFMEMGQFHLFLLYIVLLYNQPVQEFEIFYEF